MDKSKANEIQEAIVALVKSHPEWGVKLTKNSASVYPNEVRISLTLLGTSADGERLAFERVAHLYGIKGEAYGAEIPGIGKLIGFNTKRPKFPVRVRTASRGEMLYTESTLRGLAAEYRAAERGDFTCSSRAGAASCPAASHSRTPRRGAAGPIR